MKLRRAALIPAVAALLLAGLWLVAGRIATSYDASIALGVVWFLLAAVVLGKLTKHRRHLRPWVRTGTIGTSVVVLAWFYWTSVRETTVTERVVTVAPAAPVDAAPPAAEADASAPEPEPEPRRNRLVAAGTVRSLAHDGEGRAQVIALAEGGRMLTLTGFRIDPGPQVVVRLVAGDDPAGGDYVNLGDLKGSRGDQQYRIPGGTRLARYDTVVFWCIPFSQALAVAELRGR